MENERGGAVSNVSLGGGRIGLGRGGREEVGGRRVEGGAGGNNGRIDSVATTLYWHIPHHHTIPPYGIGWVGWIARLC